MTAINLWTLVYGRGEPFGLVLGVLVDHVPILAERRKQHWIGEEVATVMEKLEGKVTKFLRGCQQSDSWSSLHMPFSA